MNVPAFCRVAGVSKPTSDSVINFEVWLPVSGWNAKLDHGGNGGYGGTLNTPAGFMLSGLLRGYATAGTDMGHDATVTPGASFALGHPEKIADWGYRAPGDFSRPLCPWPQAARWTMTGSAKDAGSFVCASPTENAHEGED